MIFPSEVVVATKSLLLSISRISIPLLTISNPSVLSSLVPSGLIKAESLKSLIAELYVNKPLLGINATISDVESCLISEIFSSLVRIIFSILLQT